MYGNKERALLHLVTESKETEVINALTADAVDDEQADQPTLDPVPAYLAVLPVCKDGICMVAWKPKRTADMRIAS